LEAELVAGRLPVERLETAVTIIAGFEYAPWRIPTVVEDLYKIWTLLRICSGSPRTEKTNVT
jgi:hypothetical protein